MLDLFSSFRLSRVPLILLFMCSFYGLVGVFSSVFTYYVVCVSGWAMTANLRLAEHCSFRLIGTYGFMLLLNRLNVSPCHTCLSYGRIFFVLGVSYHCRYHLAKQVPALLFTAVFVSLGATRAGL